MNKKYKSIILPVSLFFALSVSVSAAPGDLDRTFSGDGKLTDWSGWAYHVVIQPDGKIVAGGLNPPFSWGFPTPNHNFLVARYNSDGSPDVTFGGGTGRVVIDSGNPDYLTGIAIQGDGKILLTGRYNNVRAVIVRLNPNGSFDTTFGSNGIATTSCSPGRIAVQSDGRIVISHFYVGACRHNPDGSRDTSFGVGGFVSTDIGEDGYRYVFSIVIQPDGKIVLAGGVDQENSNPPRYFVLIRYNQDGSLDTSFGGTGIVITRPTDDFGLAFKVLLQPDGKIVAVGELYIVRYNANGSLDSAFGVGGIASCPPFPGDSLSGDAALQTDGKILVSGTGGIDYTNWDFALARYNTNGSLDTTFGGGDGITSVDFNNSNDIASAVALDSQGRAVIVGTADEAFAIARFLLKSNIPFDFDGDGRSDISVFRPSNGEWWYIRSSDAAAGAAQFSASTDLPVPGDYTGDGKADIAHFRPATGEWFILRSEDGSYYSYPFGLSGDIPAPADYDGDGKTDTATFRPSTQTWYIFNSATATYSILTFGLDGDHPVPADYDGDGKADIAVWRPSNGTWWIVSSSNLEQKGYGFGLSTDKPVVGDYTGDGKADIAVWRDATREWFFLRSDDNFSSYYSYPSGLPGDIPAPGDYDGDGRFDSAVFRPSTQTWYIDGSTAGSMITTFGLNGDRPVANAYVP